MLKCILKCMLFSFFRRILFDGFFLEMWEIPGGLRVFVTNHLIVFDLCIENESTHIKCYLNIWRGEKALEILLEKKTHAHKHTNVTRLTWKSKEKGLISIMFSTWSPSSDLLNEAPVMTTWCASSSSAVTAAHGAAAPPTGHIQNLQLKKITIFTGQMCANS